MTRGSLRTMGWILIALGVLAVVAAILYFVLPAHSLPAFMGPATHASKHRTKRGIAALVVGVVLLAISWYPFRRAKGTLEL